MAQTRRVLLGRIGRAHGIRGEVAIETFTASPEAIAGYGPLSDATGTRTFRVTAVRIAGKSAIGRIAGVDDRTAAEALRGTELYVERARLPDPEPGAYYHEDLVGLAAVDRSGRPLGTVAAIANYGAGDLIEIRRPGARDTDLVPFTDAFVPEVDLAAGRIVVVLPDEKGEPDTR